MKSIISLYKSAFGGLSASTWMLALVIFINRSGTMVIPFLSIYLTTSLGFSLVETGWVMSAFGLGAIGGGFIGGWLTDKIGPFKVQTFSLIAGGFMFFALSQVHSFYSISAFIFCVSLVSEMLRPANQISVASFAKPENITRALSLNRMAINLGFSFGPALGGLLAALSYDWLFIADGVTCILAGIVFFFYFRNQKGTRPNVEEKGTIPIASKSVWSDGLFIGFIALVIGFAMMFFQIFSTWPLYQREVFQLQEQEIGLLLGLNGLIVFLFEMILVYKIGDRFQIRKLMAFGSFLMGLAFLMLYGFETKWALYGACILISFAEIFAMPFMATYTIQKSGEKNKGAYMGLYSVAFASAFVLAPLIGTNVIAAWDFQSWWLIVGGMALGVGIGFLVLLRNKIAPIPEIH
ncbi:MAG: putative MFS family arabinose efflux permease [Cyclobacteriaceae bacterium]|jgi:predicted MFS family arabinose efflux permease